MTAGLRADDSREGRDDNGYLVVQAIAAPENMAKVETAVREEFARWIEDGVTEQELRDAVSARLVAREQSRAEDGNVASLLTGHLQVGRDMQFEIDRDAASQALTVDQVNAAIRKHFRPESLSAFVAGNVAHLVN